MSPELEARHEIIQRAQEWVGVGEVDDTSLLLIRELVQHLRDAPLPSRVPRQAEVLAWVAARWPDYTSPVWRAMKAGEEAGEILGAVTKEELGLKPPGTIAVESAQAVLCIMSLAESVGFDLWEAVAADWETMKTRTWSPA